MIGDRCMDLTCQVQISYFCQLQNSGAKFTKTVPLVFLCGSKIQDTVKPVYKRHSRELEDVPFTYWLKLYALFVNEEKIRLPFTDSDLL